MIALFSVQSPKEWAIILRRLQTVSKADQQTGRYLQSVGCTLTGQCRIGRIQFEFSTAHVLLMARAQRYQMSNPRSITCSCAEKSVPLSAKNWLELFICVKPRGRLLHSWLKNLQSQSIIPAVWSLLCGGFEFCVVMCVNEISLSLCSV